MTGVVASKSGIRDLLQDTTAEGLDIDSVLGDIRSYGPRCNFDVLVFDRVLHMLGAAECANMLSRLLTDVNAQPVVLIAYQR